MILIWTQNQQPPFVIAIDTNKTSGNENFKGYCIDLLKEILNHTEPENRFEYDIVSVKEFGKRQPNGQWTGMIGELKEKVNFLQ